ncbi:MAG: hypothetical protein AAFY71_20720 [Bacteroidota bacterium]
MNRILLISILLVSTSIFVSCRETEEPMLPDNPTFADVNLLLNPGFEEGKAANSINPFETDSIPANWEDALVGPTYQVRWVKDTALVGERSLRLSSNWVDPAALAYVEQTIPFTQNGKRLKISALIQVQDVEGEGVAFEVLGNTDENNNEAEFTQTTEMRIPIKGTAGWTSYGFTSDPVPDGITSLTYRIYMLRSTTGFAYVDEVTLLAEE